jgi:serine/threonine-protein kinase
VTSTSASSSRLAVPIPSGQQIERAGLAPLAISPDGARIAYAAVERGGRTRLFVRPLDRFDATAIEGTEGASAPFFSPDGRWIGFYANGMLQRVSIDGGAALRIGETAPVWSATWGADDVIVFAGSSTPGGLWRIPVGGGTPEQVTTVEPGENQHAYPSRLPNGDVLFGVITDRGWHLSRLALGSKQVTPLTQPGSGGAGARYVESGHLVYASGGGLVAVPFNPVTGALGPALPLLERPEIDPSGSAAFAVSANGTMVYVPRASTLPSRSLVIVDRTGRAALINDTRAAYAHPRLSPDGKRLAVTIESENGADIWVYDLVRGSRTRLTNGGVNGFPVWSHDGQRITFQSARSGGVSMYSRPADGSAEPEPLIRAQGDSGLSRSLAGLLPGSMPTFTAANPHVPMSWSPDGANLAFDERKPSAERDIWILNRDGAASPFLVTPFDESSPAFSPDGKWLAYVSDESGRGEVYVQPFPGPGGKWVISTEGGREPAWSVDGRELYFRQGDALMSVAVAASASEFKAGRPAALFSARYEQMDGTRNYDVSPDRLSFVAVRNEGAAEMNQLNVVLNWFAEVRARQ